MTVRTASKITILLLLLWGMTGAVTAVPYQQSTTTPVEIDNSVVREELDDVAQITVSVPSGERGSLQIEGESYQSELTFVDSDGDGSVSIQFNTFRERVATSSGSGYSALGADRVTSVSTQRANALTTGRYLVTLNVEGYESDISLLRIVPGEFSDVSVRSLPASASMQSLTDIEQVNESGSSVAHKDSVVATFHAEGIQGPARLTDLPGNNLIYPASSQPAARTTHTVQVSGDDGAESFRSVQIRYGEGDGGIPSRLPSASIQHFGIDSDGDGQIERSLQDRLGDISVQRAGVLTLPLDSSAQLNDSETLLIQYDGIGNPEKTGADQVAIAVGERVVDGEIEYGLRGSGTLGNGLDLSVGETARPTIAPLPVDIQLVPATDRLYVVYSGTTAESHPAGSSLTISLEKPARAGVGAQSLTTEVAFVERQATLALGDESPLKSTGTTLSGTTSIAPGSTVYVTLREVETASPRSLTYPTVVDSQGTFSVRVNESTLADGQTFEVFVSDSRTEISPRYRAVVR